MKRTAGLAILTLVTVAGLVPAAAASPPRALAFPGARGGTGAGATGGTRLWVAHYRDHTQQNFAQAAVASPDGSTVFVTGSSGLEHIVTIAYNAATGSRKWLAVYRGRRPSEQTQSVAASPDGQKVFVASPVASSSGGPFIATLAYDAATGAALWTRFAKGTADARPGSAASGTSR